MSGPEPTPKMPRRDQAITHAADLLREGGPTGLTSVAVAERMGVTQPAVYRHVRNMDELSALAAEVVVAELNQSLHDLMFDPNLDWEEINDVSRLCRDLIDQAVRNRQSFEVVARWRFVDGQLGTGIRKVIDEGCDLIAVLLESRWRIEFGYEAPLDDEEHAAVGAHARVLHDDWHAVARLANSPSLAPLESDDVAMIMQHRIMAGWASFVIDMNERVGLPFPQIDLQPGIVPD
jgi:AcrR family transcriptional regulator